MSHSRTWVLCANEESAKIFRLDVSIGSIQFVQDLQATSSEFDRLLAEEAEFACGFGSNEKIVLCGEFRILNRICRQMENAVRSRIIGIIPRNIVSEPAETVRILSETFALKHSA